MELDAIEVGTGGEMRAEVTEWRYGNCTSGCRPLYALHDCAGGVVCFGGGEEISQLDLRLVFGGLDQDRHAGGATRRARR